MTGRVVGPGIHATRDDVVRALHAAVVAENARKWARHGLGRLAWIEYVLRGKALARARGIVLPPVLEAVEGVGPTRVGEIARAVWYERERVV